jgi:nitrite reductase/ring-hydroxylating ferredoxin subunit
MKRIVDYKDDNHGNNIDNNSSTFRYLCKTKEIQIAVFNVDGKLYCIANKCQHQGGPLSKGILDKEKKVVTCPWHGWKYSIIDGNL